MKIQRIGEVRVILSNPDSARNYFAWPTVTRTMDERIAVSASGYRIAHICPFGKAVLVFSEDEGETYSAPDAVIDTVLDDRDSGLCAYGESGLILTSFNNTVAFQRQSCIKRQECYDYLDTVDPEEEKKALGSTFRMSPDNGKTWGPLLHAPVTSPHGPMFLHDGRILWVGRRFGASHDDGRERPFLQVVEILPDGTTAFVGAIDNIYEDGELLASYEPHAIELPDGTLICHIRVEGRGMFTTYQTESVDGGKSWTKPHRLLDSRGGAPAHLYLHSSGILLSAYGYRESPYGIRVMLSEDGGGHWQTDEILYEQTVSADLGYPATVECRDGSLLTVFYAHPEPGLPAVILQQKWKLL